MWVDADCECKGKQRRQRLKGRVDPLGLEADDDNGDMAMLMAFDSANAPRDELPVPSSLAELSAQVLPSAPPPPPPPKVSRLEPRGSFIRTRVSKKDKQAGKRELFAQTIAAAAAARQPPAAVDSAPTTTTTTAAEPVVLAPAESFVDDFLSAMADISTAAPSATSSAGGVGASAAWLSSARTSQQRARIERSERDQFKAVLQHGAFKQDPLDALREHLGNRLRLEQEAREAQQRQAAHADTLATHEVGATRRLERAITKNRKKAANKKGAAQ